MINAVIELGDRRIHEVMVPRIAIVALPASATFDEAIDLIIEEGHSRVPCTRPRSTRSSGSCTRRTCCRSSSPTPDARPDLRTLLRTPVFVPESMTIDDLLHEFQRRKVHIAIVLDEYGGTAGLVTIEDLLEEIVGEIQDEYDEEEPLVERLDDDRARVDGRAVGRGPARAVGHQGSARGRRRVRHGRRARVPPDRRHPVAGRRGPRRRPAADGGDDRRPAGRARCSWSASGRSTTSRARRRRVSASLGARGSPAQRVYGRVVERLSQEHGGTPVASPGLAGNGELDRRGDTSRGAPVAPAEGQAARAEHR